MLFLSRLYVFAFAATSVLAIVDFNTVLSDLATVDSDVNQVSPAISAYSGNLSQLQNIQNAFAKLRKDIQQTTIDTNNSPVPSEADANKVLDYFGGKLSSDTTGTANVAVNDKSRFEQFAATKPIHDGFAGWKNDLDTLANALIAKVPTSATKTKGQNIKTAYDNLLQKVINDYTK